MQTNLEAFSGGGVRGTQGVSSCSSFYRFITPESGGAAHQAGAIVFVFITPGLSYERRLCSSQHTACGSSPSSPPFPPSHSLCHRSIPPHSSPLLIRCKLDCLFQNMLRDLKRICKHIPRRAPWFPRIHDFSIEYPGNQGSIPNHFLAFSY